MVNIFDIIDSHKYKFVDDLKSLGFKQNQITSPLKSIQKDIIEEYDLLQKKNFEEAKNAVNRWEVKLTQLLGTPNTWGNGRRPALRKYPASVSGSLMNSIKIDLDRTVQNGKWTYEFTGKITGGGSDGKDHARLTNDGVNSGQRNVRWKGWFDETFDMGHSSSLIGARVLMEQVFRSL